MPRCGPDSYRDGRRAKRRKKECPDGGIGRRAGLKHQYLHGYLGSTPSSGTKEHATALKGIKGHLRKLSDLFFLFAQNNLLPKINKKFAQSNNCIYICNHIVAQ